MSASSVEVGLPDRSYTVRIGRGALRGLGGDARALLGEGARRVLLVRDTGVPDSFVGALEGELAGAGFAVRVCALTPSESMKTLETVEGLLREAAVFGLTRVDAVIALGGGVVGDIAGFVASSYQRGVPVIQCPSTLLSMVDASVGGKTGVNLCVDGALYKNLVGAFHQPRLVVADTALLDSLDGRDFRCGLAECIKHAMICRSVGGGEHAGLLDWTDEHLARVVGMDGDAIEELVRRNVALKACVVAGDERESPEARAGGRMLLNFGHTFGHAIETLAGVRPRGAGVGEGLRHGEAVGLGMCGACVAGESLGLCDSSVGERLRGMLGRAGLPRLVDGLASTGDVIARMRHDKKASGSALRVILPEGEGRCRIVSEPDESALQAGVESIRRGWGID